MSHEVIKINVTEIAVVEVETVASGNVEVVVSDPAYGNMIKETYDPTNVSGDAFSMGNMAETALKKILTEAERNQLTTLAEDLAAKMALSPDYIDLQTGLANPSRLEGRLFYDDERKCLGFYIDETEFTWQIGREFPMRVYNDTGGTLLNGRAAAVVGVGTGGGSYVLPYINYASAALDEGIYRNTIGIITHDIEDETFGEVTILGWVNDVSTLSPLVAGEVAWLAASSPPDGTMTAVRPGSPDYAMEMGGCLVSDAVNGVLWADYLPGGNTGDVLKIFNGAILEDHTVEVTSNGTIITLALDDSADFLSLFYNAAFTKIDVPATATLTAGTDVLPVENYVYILQSAPTVLAVSTSSFPTGVQFTPIAQVLCQSASSIQNDGAYKVHAWTDHLAGADGMGHLSHINKWIRNQHATWLSGGLLSFNGSGTTTVNTARTAAKILQLHEHDCDAIGSLPGTPADLHVVNDDTTAYRKTTNIASILLDSTGASLSNKYFALVFWGVVNEDPSECKIMCNLPSGSYNSEIGAVDDVNKYANYSIPAEFKGTGFLLHRMICFWNSPLTAFTYYTNDGDDLRGTYPSTVAGGGSPASSDAVLGPASATDDAIPRFDGTTGKLVKNSSVTINDDGNVAGAGSKSNAQVGTSYTLVLTDKGKHITRNNAAASTLTVPANASIAYPIDTVINLLNIGAGIVTVGITTDTLNAKGSNFDLVQGAAATLVKTGSTTWWLFGDLS